MNLKEFLSKFKDLVDSSTMISELQYELETLIKYKELYLNSLPIKEGDRVEFLGDCASPNVLDSYPYLKSGNTGVVKKLLLDYSSNIKVQVVPDIAITVSKIQSKVFIASTLGYLITVPINKLTKTNKPAITALIRCDKCNKKSIYDDPNMHWRCSCGGDLEVLTTYQE